jgi:hypothetical protein
MRWLGRGWRFQVSARRWLSLFAVFAPLAGSTAVCAQSITEQKETVAFAFGTAHMPDASKALRPVYGPLGTVFFVSYPDSRAGPDRGFFYLVTAKHVLKDADGTYLKEISVRMNVRDPTTSKGYEDIEHIPVADPQGNLTWLHDSDDAVDVAAIGFLPDEKKYDFKAIPISMFVDDAELHSDQVSEGDSLYFIGLMAQYYGENKNYPVVRRGSLALMTDEKIDTPTGRQKAFIAELVSWPGNSGSPVFLSLGGLRAGHLMLGTNLKFLGVLSGSFLNVLRGTILDSQTVQWGSAFNTGVSFIVTADRVKAVLDSPIAQAARDAEIQRLQK